MMYRTSGRRCWRGGGSGRGRGVGGRARGGRQAGGGALAPARGLPQQPLPQLAAAGPRQSYRRVLAGSTWI